MVSNAEFVAYLKNDLRLAVPDWLTETKVTMFVQRQILSLRKKEGTAQTETALLTVADL